MKPVKNMPRKLSAFSLIELLVVLAILAALTTVALRSVNGVQGQAKYLQTTSTLNQLRDAIIGPANLRGPDGSALVTGFVADVGRLPNYLVSSSDPLPLQSPALPGDPFDELFEQNSIPSFAYKSAPDDPGVTVGVGWQGPYLRLGAGPTFTRDGWGHSFHVYDATGNPVTTPGTAIAQISSWGLDNVADTNHGGTGDLAGYDADISIPNASNLSSGFSATGILQGQVSMNVGLDASGTSTGPAPNNTDLGLGVCLWVVYYGPNPDGTVSQVPVEIADQGAASGSALYWPSTRTSFSFTISSITNNNVTIGPRVLRAYILPANTSSFTSTTISSLGSGQPFIESQPLPVTVTGGYQTVPTLVLPHYAPTP
jgi:prepilin-type N-terminal cleavage/methylation domain-containing protein